MRRPPRPALLLALSLAVVAGGCVTRPPPGPPAAPPVTLDSSTFVGTPLGPTTRRVPDATRADVGLEVTWHAAARAPAYTLLPLDAQSDLTSSPLAGDPVLTAGRQTRRARFGTADAADDLFARLRAGRDGPTVELGRQTALLAPGTVARFHCDAAGPGVTLSVARPASAGTPSDAAAAAVDPTARRQPAATAPATTAPMTIAATMTAATTPAATMTATPAARGTVTVALRGFPDDDGRTIDAVETARLDDQPLSPGSRFALLVPTNFGRGPWAVLTASVRVVTADAARQSASRPATRPDTTTTPADARPTLTAAVANLRVAADPRPALLFLATTTGATIAADCVLVADAPVLGRLRDSVAAALGGLPVDADEGWLVDRATILALAAAAEKGPLPPELSAVLVVHAGEVGRRPDAVADLAKTVGSQNDLRARLVGENYIALEDNAPAARVRAFDWLKGVGRAPADYDPLADARSRRRAINRSIDNSAGPR